MGRNPYIKTDVPPLPTRPYRLTVRRGDEEQHIAVDPANLPQNFDGHPGSVLSLMLAAGIEIDHSCGGVCACSTCHLYILRGAKTSPEPIEEEEDQLDFAPAVQDNSRLGCQFVPDGSEDVVVEVPGWNRNEVSEDH